MPPTSKPKPTRQTRPNRRTAKKRISPPVRITYQLKHYDSTHFAVEPHDYEWYSNGGRKYYALDGRELTTLLEIEQAIERDGTVESR